MKKIFNTVFTFHSGFFVLFLIILISFSSCQKTGANGDSSGGTQGGTSVTPPSLTITDFTPSTGSSVTYVLITGTNFNTNISNDVVSFNGVAATVRSATSTSLIVEVPTGATTGKITITANNKTATSVSDFKVATVSTFAGNGVMGHKDGSAAAAEFDNINSLAVDAAGNVYAADYGNYCVRKITPAGIVSTLAGSPPAYSGGGFLNGTGTAATFNYIEAITADAQGDVYVADRLFNAIRKITPAGVVTTLAGGTGGSADGTGTAAQFGPVMGIATDAAGNIYAADQGNGIRKITPAGVVTTLHFQSNSGVSWAPFAIAVDAMNNLYVTRILGADYFLSKITPAGVITDFKFYNNNDFDPDDAGTALPNTYFVGACNMTVDAAGNVYLCNSLGVQKLITDASGITNIVTIAGNGPGYKDGAGTSSLFNVVQAIALDASGNIYVGEGAGRVRKIVQ
jgi:hypothetical protein